MGFWKFNPAEPCCNPPAGYCQCQPCRWRVVEITGPDFETLEIPAGDYFEATGVTHSMQGWVNHCALLRNGAISVRPKPWFRLWQKEFAVPWTSNLHHWIFGYGRWVIPGATSIDPALFSETTWGFGIRDRLTASPPNIFPKLDNNLEWPLWIHYQPLSGRWKCWGENRLYHWTLDPTLYVVVEPDV